MGSKFYFVFISLLYFAIEGNGQQNLYFPPSGNNWETVSPASLGWKVELLDDLRSFLEEKHTKSFIVLKDGKIVIEYYLNGHDATKNWYWASAGKSLTSLLAAFAETDGKLDINNPSSAYLGEGWSSCTPMQEKNILVKHHLTMTTGLDESVSFDCTEKECLKYKADPGTRWTYHNAPYTLMDGIIEGATGQNLNLYFKNKLGDKIGMTGLFLKSDFNNVFYSTARNMARFGLFVLANGQWQNNKILDNPTYFDKMSKSSQSLNPAYGYLWWLNGKDKFMLPSSQIVFDGALFPQAPSDMFSALGKNDQKVHIVPSLGLVVIRMGEAASDADVNVPIIFDRELWTKLSSIMKLQTAVTETPPLFSKEKIAHCYGGKIHISDDIDLDKVEIFGLNGQLVYDAPIVHTFDVGNIKQGVYLMSIKTKDGHHYINKVFVR